MQTKMPGLGTRVSCLAHGVACWVRPTMHCRCVRGHSGVGRLSLYRIKRCPKVGARQLPGSAVNTVVTRIQQGRCHQVSRVLMCHTVPGLYLSKPGFRNIVRKPVPWSHRAAALCDSLGLTRVAGFQQPAISAPQ